MSKINLKKYYIEEHIYESYSNNSNFLLDYATFNLSKRLTELHKDGFKIGDRYEGDFRKMYIPDTLIGEPCPTDYHFLIALPAKLPRSINGEGKVKFTIMRLLNNDSFLEELKSWQHILKVYRETKDDPDITKKIDEIIAKTNSQPYSETQLDKAVRQYAKRNEFDMEDIDLNEILIYPLLLSLAKKYKLASEYHQLLRSFLEDGVDYVLQNLPFISGGSLSYLDYFGSIFYLTKPHDPRIEPEIKARLTKTTTGSHLKHVEPVIQYFQNKYLPKSPPPPPSDTDFESQFSLFSMDKFGELKDLKKARILLNIPKGQPCGKTETNKIAAIRRRYNNLLNKYDTK